MKILLDECINKRLKNHLTDFQVYTITELGWSGIKNGKLMTLCVENNFDILLTIDKNLRFQQNLDKYFLTIAILNSRNSKLNELLEILPFFMNCIQDLKKHKAYLINKSEVV